jgi:hypothetical protein
MVGVMNFGRGRVQIASLFQISGQSEMYLETRTAAASAAAATCFASQRGGKNAIRASIKAAIAAAF